MAEFPALPLYTDAILADCSHLSDAEFGLYMRAIILIWRSPDCRIPNDDEWISRKLRCSPEDINPLLSEFCECDGNWVKQKRLLKERDYLRKQSKKQSDAAKSRWNKEKDLCHGNAARHASGNAPTPTPTYVSKDTEEDSIQSLIFGAGLKYLLKHSGMNEKELRSLIGKWRKQSGDQATLDAMRLSQKQAASQPIEYISGILKPKVKPRYSETKSNVRTI